MHLHHAPLVLRPFDRSSAARVCLRGPRSCSIAASVRSHRHLTVSARTLRVPRHRSRVGARRCAVCRARLPVAGRSFPWPRRADGCSSDSGHGMAAHARGMRMVRCGAAKPMVFVAIRRLEWQLPRVVVDERLAFLDPSKPFSICSRAVSCARSTVTYGRKCNLECVVH